MNKRPNPFMPNPYPQPPLPAGPPPPGPAQQTQQYDYSAYWAAAAAAQQTQTGAQTTPQWAPPTVGTQPPQAPRTQEQNALYANYGYGGAAGQQQAMLAAQQQQQQQRPAAPYWTPPAPGYAAAAPYPYQQPTAYQPQPPPPVIPYTPQAPPMPMYQHHPHPQVAPPPPPPQPQRRFQPPQQPQQQPHHLPAPPAKRPRFDSGPPANNNNNPNWRNNSNGIPTGPAQHGNFPPQQPGFERFTGSRGGRGGAVVAASHNRGRGFNRGNFRHGHGNNPPRGPSGYRNPGPSGAPYGPRHGLPANPTKREREAKRERERDREGSYAESEGAGVERHGGKRTLTDFRIVGVECGAIGWEWGRVKDDKDKDKDDEDKTEVKDEPTSPVKSVAKTPQPAPSRLRIYFHSASDPEADALPRKRKKDADEEDEEGGGVRKKVQGNEDTPAPEKPSEKEGENDDHEDTAPENVDEDKHEDLGDEQDADGEDDVDHIPKPEQEDPHFPEDGSPDEQDAVSHKPPPTPTPGESTPVALESTPVPVEGQAPVENDEHPIADPAPSITPDGIVSSEAGDVSVVEDSLAETHGPDPESEAHDAADMSASTIDEPIAFPSLDSPAKAQPQVPGRSANRISISYANSTRRLVIDADVVNKVRIVRAKARVEITLAVEVVKGDDVEAEGGDEKLVLSEHDRFRGVLVEVYNESTQRYELITPYAASHGADLTIPDLSKIEHTPSEITIIVHLDRDKPLTETKWVKTGDLDEWLSNEFGPLRPDPSGGRAHWSGKIHVADPDPAPTITTLMDAWCGHTMVGQPKERRRFVRQYMSNIDHVLEILLRLVRGERATAGSSSGSNSGGGGDRGGGQQQTHVSLAVLAIFRVATDYGARAGVERQVVEERVSEIVRSLPTHLVYKSLDGMFREWSFTLKKADKGGVKDKDKS